MNHEIVAKILLKKITQDTVIFIKRNPITAVKTGAFHSDEIG